MVKPIFLKNKSIYLFASLACCKWIIYHEWYEKWCSLTIMKGTTLSTPPSTGLSGIQFSNRSPTPRLVRVCTFWHTSHQWHIYFLLNIQLDNVKLFSKSCRGWSWSTLFDMSECSFSRDAGHIEDQSAQVNLNLSMCNNVSCKHCWFFVYFRWFFPVVVRRQIILRFKECKYIAYRVYSHWE